MLRRMHTSKIAMGLHQKWEREVLQQADLVLAATPAMAESLEQLGGRRVETLLNGLDVQALPAAAGNPQHPHKFRLFHAGMLNEGRNPEHLWPVLSRLCQQDTAFAEALEVLLVGSVSPLVDPVPRFPVLEGKIKRLPHVPNQQVWTLMQQSAVLSGKPM